MFDPANPVSAPKITVVLPCFNSHQYLQQTLDSLFAQTFDDFEIIVVNDGSTDPETVAFLDTLPPPIQLLRQNNLGLPAARNTGFRHAKGKYILPLDCDDWLDPEYLQTAYNLITSTPEKVIIYSHLDVFGDVTGILHKHYNFFEQLFLNQLPYCLLMPKSAWHELGGYDESMRRGYEDWEFNIRLGRHGYNAIPMDRALFHYRVSTSGMLKSISRHKHGQLWKSIRTKNPKAYSPLRLIRTWSKWRKRPSTYPLFLYFGWIFLHKILPNSIFASLFRQLLPYSHSSRAGQNSAS